MNYKLELPCEDCKGTGKWSHYGEDDGEPCYHDPCEKCKDTGKINVEITAEEIFDDLYNIASYRYSNKELQAIYRIKANQKFISVENVQKLIELYVRKEREK